MRKEDDESGGPAPPKEYSEKLFFFNVEKINELFHSIEEHEFNGTVHLKIILMICQILVVVSAPSAGVIEKKKKNFLKYFEE